MQVIHIFFSDQDTAASVTTDDTTLPNPDTTGKIFILRLWRELHASFCRGGNSSAVTYVNYHITTRIPEPNTMHVLRLHRSWELKKKTLFHYIRMTS